RLVSLGSARRDAHPLGHLRGALRGQQSAGGQTGGDPDPTHDSPPRLRSLRARTAAGGKEVSRWSRVRSRHSTLHSAWGGFVLRALGPSGLEFLRIPAPIRARNAPGWDVEILIEEYRRELLVALVPPAARGVRERALRSPGPASRGVSALEDRPLLRWPLAQRGGLVARRGPDDRRSGIRPRGARRPGRVRGGLVRVGGIEERRHRRVDGRDLRKDGGVL